MPSTNKHPMERVEIPRLNGNQNIGGAPVPQDNAVLMNMIFQYLDDHSPLSPSDDLPFKQKLPGVMQWRDAVPTGYAPSPIEWRNGMKEDYENSFLDSAPSPTGSVFSDTSSYDDESVESLDSDGPTTPPSRPTIPDGKVSKHNSYNLEIPGKVASSSSSAFGASRSQKAPTPTPTKQRLQSKLERFASQSECTLQRSRQYHEKIGPKLPTRPVFSNFNSSKSEHYFQPKKAPPSPPQPMYATITNVADIMPEFVASGASTPEEIRKSISKELRIVTEKLTPTSKSTPASPSMRSASMRSAYSAYSSTYSRSSQMSDKQHIGNLISPNQIVSPTPRKSTPVTNVSKGVLNNLKEDFIISPATPAKRSEPSPGITNKHLHLEFEDFSPRAFALSRPFSFEIPPKQADKILSPVQRIADSNDVSPLSSSGGPSPILKFKQTPNDLMSPLRQVQAQESHTPLSAKSVHFAPVDETVTIPPIPARSRRRTIVEEQPTIPLEREARFGSNEWSMALHCPSDSDSDIHPDSDSEETSSLTKSVDVSPIQYASIHGQMEFSSDEEDSSSSHTSEINFAPIDFGGKLELKIDLDREISPAEEEEFDYEEMVKRSAQMLADAKDLPPPSPLHPVLRKMNVGKWFTRGFFAGEKGMHMTMSRRVVNFSRTEWHIEDPHGAQVLKCFSQTNSLSRQRDFWDMDGNQICRFHRKMGTTRVAESTRGYELFSVKQASLYSMPHWTVELSGGHNKNSAQWVAKGDDELKNVVVNWGGFEVGRISCVPGHKRHTYNVTTAREMNYCIMAALCTVFDDLRTDEGC